MDILALTSRREKMHIQFVMTYFLAAEDLFRLSDWLQLLLAYITFLNLEWQSNINSQLLLLQFYFSLYENYFWKIRN